MKMLYIGYDLNDSKVGGASTVRRANYKLIKEIFEKKFESYFITLSSNKLKILKDLIFFKFNGYNKNLEKEILSIIKNKKIDILFFEGSYFGSLYIKIKKNFPNIKIITYYHNIEKIYQKEKIKVEGKTRYIQYPTIVKNEKIATKLSDYNIVLSKREEKELKENYTVLGKIINIPIFFEDKFFQQEEKSNKPYYLFVGSAFFANIDGVDWFIKNVLPYLSWDLIVVGDGMEKILKNYIGNKKVKILGRVANLEKYYYENNIVIAPIFFGSGMKTKVIEALMYGKTIVGTSEAFAGINIKEELVGGICNDSINFINTLIKFEKETEYKSYNKNSREYFLKHYEKSIIKAKYISIIKEKHEDL